MTGARPLAAHPDHAMHDPLLVAEAADRAGRLPPALAECPDCRTLHADLVQLAAALPTAAVATRPLAYTLTPADAARLRAGGLRRWLALIGSARDGITRPLALGFTTLGLAGLLVATLPAVLSGGAATAGAAPQSVGEAASALPSVVPAMGAPDVASSAAATDDGAVFSGAESGASPGSDAKADATTRDAAALALRGDPSGPSVLFVVGGALLILGLGLFGLRWTGRRLGGG